MSRSPNPDALKIAFTALTRRDRFEGEIREQLLGFDKREIDVVISELRERRMIDDRRLVERLVEANRGRRAKGADRMREELLRRGAPESLVEEFLGSGDAERADAALGGKFSSQNSGDRARAGRFLMGRGFDEETTASALDRFFGSLDSD